MSNILKINSGKKVNVRINGHELSNKFAAEDEETKTRTLIQAAHEEGIVEGRNSAMNELKEKYDSELGDNILIIENIVIEMDNQMKQYERLFEKLVVETSFILSEKIIRRQIDKETIINETLTESIKKVIGANKFIAKINPKDMELLNNESKNLIKEVAATKIKFESDESIQQGGCFIETDIGNADGRITSQLNELKKAFDNNVFVNEEEYDS